MDIIDLSFEQQYKNLLENAKNTLRTSSQRKGKKPPQRLSRRELIRNQYAFQPQPGSSQRKEIQTSYIMHKFPPSVAPLSTLQKTYINDLLLETNHRGSYILLRTIAPPTKMTAVMSAVEDEKGGCDFIQLYNMSEDRQPKKSLPEGQVLIVKEPFYKININGTTGIRVDHVSDLILLSPNDNRIPLEWQPRIRLLDKSPMDWKEEGNVFFRNNEFYEAIECYTQGLEIESNDIALVKTLRLNRSQAFLSIGFHEKALRDSEHVLKVLDPTDEKALFRGAKSLYMARKFENCKTLLTTLVRTYPDNKEAKETLLKVYNRLQEERTGKYDFQEMRRLTTSGGPVKFDCADFVGPVCLKNTLNMGRGLFTTRDVKFGELLLCTKAFQVCYPKIDGISVVFDVQDERVEMSNGPRMVPDIIQKLYNNPSASNELLGLYSGTHECVKEKYVDGNPVVDTFLAHEIRRLNGFGCPLLSGVSSSISQVDDTKEKESDNGGSGIWVMASYINHACWGTVYRTFIGDMMIVRARTDMKSGEELTFTYVGYKDVKLRQKVCRDHWGFTCNCYICTVEIQESDAVRQHRDTLMGKILTYESLLKQPNSRGLISALPKITQSIKSLEATYRKPSTKQPRYALAKGLQFLSTVYLHLGSSHSREFIETIQRMVMAQGCNIEEYPEQGKVVVRRYGFMLDPVNLAGAFVQCAAAYSICSNYLMAKAYQRVAADFYEVAYGERASFSEMFGGHFKDVGLSLLQ